MSGIPAAEEAPKVRLPSIPKRLYSLDVLRGLAALSVVFWHWQHFSYSGTQPAIVSPERLPLYPVFFLFYTKGALAVDLFFSLSGFVFFWLYSDSVSRKTISGREFAWLRFTRLYPLHLATLLAVAFGQWAYHSRTGAFFVYHFNDAKHFALNLFLGSSWGLENGFSFNGPVWSVSVEVALYAMFFLWCRRLPIRMIGLAAMSAAGFLLITRLYAPIGRGVG